MTFAGIAVIVLAAMLVATISVRLDDRLDRDTVTVTCPCGETTEIKFEPHPNHFVEVHCIIHGKLTPTGDGLVR